MEIFFSNNFSSLPNVFETTVQKLSLGRDFAKKEKKEKKPYFFLFLYTMAFKHIAEVFMK